jgi:hypothetical protein
MRHLLMLEIAAVSALSLITCANAHAQFIQLAELAAPGSLYLGGSVSIFMATSLSSETATPRWGRTNSKVRRTYTLDPSAVGEP